MRHKFETRPLQDKFFDRLDICVRCGLKRHVKIFKSYKSYSYTRNKICFQNAPDCFDMNEENKKTID